MIYTISMTLLEIFAAVPAACKGRLIHNFLTGEVVSHTLAPDEMLILEYLGIVRFADGTWILTREVGWKLRHFFLQLEAFLYDHIRSTATH